MSEGSKGLRRTMALMCLRNRLTRRLLYSSVLYISNRTKSNKTPSFVWPTVLLNQKLEKCTMSWRTPEQRHDCHEEDRISIPAMSSVYRIYNT